MLQLETGANNVAYPLEYSQTMNFAAVFTYWLRVLRLRSCSSRLPLAGRARRTHCRRRLAQT